MFMIVEGIHLRRWLKNSSKVTGQAKKVFDETKSI